MKRENESEQSVNEHIEIERLSSWLDIVERDVNVHFNSWSWKIGWWIVKILKIATLQDHRSSNHYRIQQVLRAFRIWRSQKGMVDDRTTVPPKKKYDYTLLVGELGKNCFEAEKDLWTSKSVQIIRFENEPTTSEFDEQDCDVFIFAKERIPRFFSKLTSALLCVSGQVAVIYDGGLTGLGLGLLLNYHFGTPLVFMEKSKEFAKLPKDSWNDDRLEDPFHPKWMNILRSYAETLTRSIENATPGVMSVSHDFAKQFSDFYQRMTG